jgi:hypothetical protein
LWLHKESWSIIEYLIFSREKDDVRDGLYILGEMVKVAKIENASFVLRNVEELFLFKLLDLSDPLNNKRLSHDALSILEVVLDASSFFKICISVLVKAMEDISSDQDYFSFIQYFFNKISIYKNKENIKGLVSRLERLFEKSEKIYTKERAKQFEIVIIQDYQELL